MNKKERGILKIEEDFRDTLENQLAKNQSENRKVRIKNIKPVGVATWTDKVNREEIKENVYQVEKEIIEVDEVGEPRTSYQVNFYLGHEPIAAIIGTDEIIYESKFQAFEVDKMEAVKSLLDNMQEMNMEKYSLKNLETKEISEVLTEHFGREVTEKEIEKMLEDMEKGDIEKLKEDKDEGKLSKEQTEKIKVNGIQKADLNKKVDGKETLGKRLDLQEYDSLFVVYSHNIDDITAGAKRDTTTYSLVGVTKNGEAKVLNDEFEIDSSVGNGGNRNQTKIKADSTATRDNSDISVYRRKSNGASIGCENSQGAVNMYFYQKTSEENENIGIQVETSKTPVIPIETREIMNRNKGVYQNDFVQDEIKEHTDVGCNPKDRRDFDGDMDTSSHLHIDEIDVNNYIPNTSITWKEFMSKCGYRGDGSLQVAVKAIQGLGDNVNDEVVEDFIEEKEEEFRTMEDNI
ncbi:MAG: hypothetical protein HFJ59_01525 [Clostridia bacterium]|nr:hypothetical protein [Clostridia bacterium]